MAKRNIIVASPGVWDQIESFDVQNQYRAVSEVGWRLALIWTFGVKVKCEQLRKENAEMAKTEEEIAEGVPWGAKVRGEEDGDETSMESRVMGDGGQYADGVRKGELEPDNHDWKRHIPHGQQPA
jgi:hypothetical protein